jgi:hypothetical protein
MALNSKKAVFVNSKYDRSESFVRKLKQQLIN